MSPAGPPLLALPIFLLIFPAVWLVVGLVLAGVTGWSKLAHRFPDRPAEPLLALKGQSGSMGGVHINRVLSFAACEPGLRIGINRFFAPFCRPILVPWDQITVRRQRTIFFYAARLQLGEPPAGSLAIFDYVANRLARAAGDRWPEPGPFAPDTPAEAFAKTLSEWALVTAFVAVLFYGLLALANRLRSHSVAWPLPLIAAIVFAILFGLASVVRYFRRTSE